MDYNKITELKNMQNELDQKLNSSNQELPVLVLGRWGVGGVSGVSTSLYLYNDKKFFTQVEMYKLGTPFEYDGIKVLPNDIKKETYKGELSDEKFNAVIKFLDENVVENYNGKMLDAGNSITYMKDGKKIVIENSSELFEQIERLLPFNIKRD